MSKRIICSMVAGVLATAACGKRNAPPETTPVAQATAAAKRPGPVPTRLLLDDLSLITTGSSADQATLDRWMTGLTSGTQTTDGVIDELLRDPRFLKRVTKVFLWDRELYLGIARFDRLPGWILKKTAGKNPIYYAREACDAAQAVEVRPWWAMKTTVRVCPDTYRPDVFWRTAERHCSASSSQPKFDKKSVCGCGPNLMRCAPDDDAFLEFRRQFMAEIEDTVADIVDRDLPLKQVYLTNETVRKPLAEMQYNVWRAERGELKELPDPHTTWPAQGKRAPRYEDERGDHAGILTTSGTQWLFSGLRPWIRTVQQSMWCSSFDNSHVEAKTLLEAARGGNANLRAGDGWKKLAAHEVCGSCHARMDYGWQFFVGYPDHRIATHFIPPKGKFAAGLHMIEPASSQNLPDLRTRMGDLYVENIQDHRGQRPLVPLEYAKWATEQPEFAACQSRRVIDHVFGPHATTEDREAITAVFEKTERLRPTLRAALKRYVERKLTAQADAPQSVPTFLAAVPSNPANTPDAVIDMMPETRALMDQYCIDCHGSENVDPTKNFDHPKLSRERMMLLLAYVADGRMPKTTSGLAPAERTKFLTALVSNLWANDNDRRVAYEYYDQRFASTFVQRPDAAISVVYERAGAKPATPVSPMIEVTIPSEELQFTPGMAAHVALEALRACKAAKAKNLEECVERASSLENIVRPK